MALSRTRFVLEKSNNALSSIPNEERDLVASFLTGYLLHVFCSEMESQIREIINNALLKHSNAGLAEFISRTMASIFKRIDKKELRNTVKYFGDAHLKTFDDNLDNVTAQMYKNFIDDRHNIAHNNKSPSISWSDIQSIAAIGEQVLIVLSKSLLQNNK